MSLLGLCYRRSAPWIKEFNSILVSFVTGMTCMVALRTQNRPKDFKCLYFYWNELIETAVYIFLDSVESQKRHINFFSPPPPHLEFCVGCARENIMTLFRVSPNIEELVFFFFHGLFHIVGILALFWLSALLTWFLTFCTPSFFTALSISACISLPVHRCSVFTAR